MKIITFYKEFWKLTRTSTDGVYLKLELQSKTCIGFQPARIIKISQLNNAITLYIPYIFRIQESHNVKHNKTDAWSSTRASAL